MDREHFRNVMSHFASGITVITTRFDGDDYGLTASAVSSVSLDPPMLLICINRRSHTYAAIHQAQFFAVNILSETQNNLARRFASSGADKFGGLNITHGTFGEPLLVDALATLECRVTVETVGGSHAVFLAEVHAGQASEGAPLTYYRGKLGHFTLLNDDAATLWKAMQWDAA